jgi:hypothetical protein
MHSLFFLCFRPLFSAKFHFANCVNLKWHNFSVSVIDNNVLCCCIVMYTARSHEAWTTVNYWRGKTCWYTVIDLWLKNFTNRNSCHFSHWKSTILCCRFCRNSNFLSCTFTRHTHTHTHTHKRTHTRTHTHTHTNARTHVRTHARTHIHTYIHIHTHTHTHTHTHSRYGHKTR